MSSSNDITDKLLKVQDFKKENISSPDLTDYMDYFEYREKEVDTKLSYLNVSAFFHSKQLIKSLYWSISIGSLFGTHRYIRTKDVKKAMRTGVVIFSFSTLFIWANFEARPFFSTVFFSNSIDNMRRTDIEKANYYNYFENQVRSGKMNKVDIDKSKVDDMDEFIRKLEFDVMRFYGTLVNDRNLEDLIVSLETDTAKGKKVTEMKEKIAKVDFAGELEAKKKKYNAELRAGLKLEKDAEYIHIRL